MRVKKAMCMMLLIAVLIMQIACPVRAVASSTKMVNMHEIISDSCKEKDEITDSYGTKYSGNILEFDTRYSGHISYDLKGQYSSFSGTLVASTNTSSNAVMNFAIYADGALVFSAIDYTRQLEGLPISLDLTGVNILEFKSSEQENYGDAWIYVVNGLFTSASVADTNYPVWSNLNNVVVVDSKSYTSSAKLLRDSYGNLHSGMHRFDTRYDGYALYNINEEYETFSGTIVAYAGSNSDALMNITIYFDNEPIYSQSNISKLTEPIDFSLDVTGVKTIKVETDYIAERNYSDSYLYITNDLLLKHRHTQGEWVIDESATCTAAGKQSAFCSSCGALVSSETISATGHTASGIWVVSSESTCSSEGTENQQCTVCGEIAETRKIEKLSHTPGKVWVESVPATCHAEGKRTLNCTVCEAVVETELIPVTAHTFGDWEKVDGSVWNSPIMKERVCAICGDIETFEDTSTSWVKPVVIVVVVLLLLCAVIFTRTSAKKKASSTVTANKNQSAHPASTSSAPTTSLLDDDLDDWLSSFVDNSAKPSSPKKTKASTSKAGSPTSSTKKDTKHYSSSKAATTFPDDSAWPDESIGERRKK